MYGETDQALLSSGRTFLERLRAEHANVVARAERLASTIESVEQTLRTLSDAPVQGHLPLEPPELIREYRIAVPAAAAIGDASAPAVRIAPASNGWARRLRGLSQHEALVQIAEDNGGVVRTGDAADILIKAGISNANRRNLYRHLLAFLTTSGKFEKAGKGTYRLLGSRPEEDYGNVAWDEVDASDPE